MNTPTTSDVVPSTPTKATIIDRQAINIHARLGSLYDATTDQFVNEDQPLQSSTLKSKTTLLQKPVCKILDYDSTNVLNYLRKIGFDETLLQSLLIGSIKPTGVSTLLDCKFSIDDKTLFFYHAFHNQEERWDATRRTMRLVQKPTSIATHVVTSLLRGFEVLCVIRVSNIHSVQSTIRLLKEVAQRCEDAKQDFSLKHEEKQQIDELQTIEIFGTNYCLDQCHQSLSQLLTTIPLWWNDTHFHHPIQYTMHPLQSLFGNQEDSPQRFPVLHGHYNFAPIEEKINRIKDIMNQIERLFEESPENIQLQRLIKQRDSLKQKHKRVCKAFKQYRSVTKDRLVQSRRGDQTSSMEVGKYPSFEVNEMTSLHDEVQRWSEKTEWIAGLTGHQVDYVDVNDLSITDQPSSDLDTLHRVILEHYGDQRRSVVALYSSDRLRKDNADEWQNRYESLVSKKKKRVYVDLSESSFDSLPNSTIKEDRSGKIFLGTNVVTDDSIHSKV